MNWDVTISAMASDADQAALRDALLEFNFATTGYRDGKYLSCFLRDDDGKLRAGIDGFTWGGYAQIEYLWIDAALRGQGLGERLLRAAEDEARRRGCRTMVLDTHSFQAPEFYPKLGYREVGRTVDTPAGHTQILFQKEL